MPLRRNDPEMEGEKKTTTKQHPYLMVTLLFFLVTSLEENLLLGEAARVNPLDTDNEVRDWVWMATGVTQTTAAAPTAEAHAAISNCRIDKGSQL